MFTVDVVLPTPPFWLATTKIRVRLGRASGGRSRAPWRASTMCSAARASGVAWSSSKVGCGDRDVLGGAHPERLRVPCAGFT